MSCCKVSVQCIGVHEPQAGILRLQRHPFTANRCTCVPTRVPARQRREARASLKSRSSSCYQLVILLNSCQQPGVAAEEGALSGCRSLALVLAKVTAQTPRQGEQ